jgi:hypothetical protein
MPTPLAQYRRRHFLRRICAALGAASLPSTVFATSAAAAAPMRVAGGWLTKDAGHHVGVVRVDWQRAEIGVEAAVPVPTRPHAVVPESGGGFLAVAARPGTWLLRIDADGRVVNRLTMADEGDARTHDGHVIASLDGQWLYTGETDRRTGDGWVSVRDARTLRKVAEYRTQGIDPHQILVDDAGKLIIANGGIPRTPDGRKRNLERMNPALVRLDAETGALLGRWTLDDPRLSPHHIAWNRPLAGQPRLMGLGLQAEHDQPAQRREAPLLAVWDGEKLTIPSRVMAEGYAGDVAAGPNGGFVVTAQYANRIVLWQPQQPGDLLTIGKVQNPCGLWPEDGPGVAIGGGLGLARWHATQSPAMLPWPAGVSADNHWALLG